MKLTGEDTAGRRPQEPVRRPQRRQGGGQRRDLDDDDGVGAAGAELPRAGEGDRDGAGPELQEPRDAHEPAPRRDEERGKVGWLTRGQWPLRPVLTVIATTSSKQHQSSNQ